MKSCRPQARGIEFILILVMLTPIFSPLRVQAKQAKNTNLSYLTNSPTALADEVIRLVNSLREKNGLNVLNPHPILMQLAQKQADYNASIGGSTHLDAAGLRPFQRALLAGYPIAGDLDLGGFYSENIINGGDLTPIQVVEAWMGDDLHANTMLSEYRTDLGVGVSFSDGMIYFVLETALYSRWPVTVPAIFSDGQDSSAPVLAPVQANTPEPDGSTYHTIRSGETLWTIAAAYSLTVEELAKMNRLDATRYIQPGKRLIIHSSGESAQTDPAVTSEVKRIVTVIPTLPLELLASPTNTSFPALTSKHTPLLPLSMNAILVIGLTLAVLAFVLAVGFRKNKTT